MAPLSRPYALVLCLAAAAGWSLGIVLLPVVVWGCAELVLAASERLRHAA